jgi:hypothetical protein
VESEQVGLPAEELLIGPQHLGQPGRWLPLGAALIAGLLLGHVTARQPTSSPARATTSAAQPAPNQPNTASVTHTAAGPDAAGCPAYRICTTRRLHSAWLLRSLASEFTDLHHASIEATDDTTTHDRYRVQLTATLARGLTIEVSADNTAAGPAEVKPWIIVAASQDGAPSYASETMLANSPDGPILHITIAATSHAPPPQLRCASCQRPIPRSAAAARLQGLTRVHRRQITRAIAIGIHAADDQQVLNLFG